MYRGDALDIGETVPGVYLNTDFSFLLQLSTLCIDNLLSVLECAACMHENMQENTSQSISLIDRFLSPSL